MSNFNIIVVIGVVLEIFSTAFASFAMRCVGRGLLLLFLFPWVCGRDGK